MNTDGTAAEQLDRDDCLRLLSTESFGRLAITTGALPVIVPVRYTIDGDRILTTAQPGSRLALGTGGAVVAFQADDSARNGWPTWTVSVTGKARTIVESAELQVAHEVLARAGWPRTPGGLSRLRPT